MGKLSRTLLNSLLITAVVADSNGGSTEEAVAYAVTSCNDESSPVSLLIFRVFIECLI